MSLKDIQNKSPEEKKRLIAIILLITSLFLVGLWIVTSKLKHTLNKDDTIIETFKTGIQDTKTNFKNPNAPDPSK